MLHLSERQGMGGSCIFKVTSDNKMRAPIIGTCPMATKPTLWKTDIAQLSSLPLVCLLLL